jgi:N-methylhydantoinase A
MRFPIRLVESGPAGGAILASQIAAELSLDNVISFDMGGTTAKICMIENQTPQTARELEVDRAARFIKGSGLPLRLPVIEMLEIGAGGGSIARIDTMGKICVGPESAGADPGPASYARGGERPTVTDADIVLGRIDPSHFVGGRVKLDPAQADTSIGKEIGGPLGIATRLAAYSVCEMVDETMANAARVHAGERGKAPAGHTLIAFGGAAPLHVGRLAEKLGIKRIVVPSDAGVGSAIGFLRAPVAYEVVKSRHMRLSEFDPALANAILDDMQAEARAVVEAAAPGAEFVTRRGAYMRYFGQGHEVFVALPSRPLAAPDDATLRAAYDVEYKRLFRRVIRDAEVEVLTWVLTLTAKSEPPEAMTEPPARPAPEAIGFRDLVDPESSRPITVPVFRRADLAGGVTLAGPGLIVEDQTSTLVPDRSTARISGAGHIVIEIDGRTAP